MAATLPFLTQSVKSVRPVEPSNPGDLLPEDLVENDLDVMGGVPVAVSVKCCPWLLRVVGSRFDGAGGGACECAISNFLPLR